MLSVADVGEAIQMEMVQLPSAGYPESIYVATSLANPFSCLNLLLIPTGH